jgi:2-polyprenyl-6-methoxyphenol hydroxylase-like FAD-dependent oxidoreductase
MFMATFLAKAGHSVGLIERHRDLYGLPRAGHSITK